MSKIKKASLAEIFAANKGVIFAGIASLDGGNESIAGLGGRAASLSFDIKGKLLSSSLDEEGAVEKILTFLQEAQGVLKREPNLILLGRKRGNQGTKDVIQDKFGSVADLLSHMSDIFFRESSGEDREISKIKMDGNFSEFKVHYLQKRKPVKKGGVSKTSAEVKPAVV